jgi:CO/xanthine dehydrogenase Mo-binding subunit
MDKYLQNRRVDGIGKVTGKAVFGADQSPGHLLYGVVKRAGIPHARIIHIRTDKAKQCPGVRAVLTASDIPGVRGFGILVPHQRVMADDKVRYFGDGVAIVAAETEEQARFAAEQIEIEYEPLPAISSPEEALKSDAPLIHESSNVAIEHRVRHGGEGDAPSETPITLESTFRTQHVEHSYIEPEAIVAWPAEHGGIVVKGSVQNLFSTRRSLAAVLALPLNNVQVIQTTLGGSFGGKDEAMTLLSCRAALLALATNRPVKMVNSREESFIESYKRHPYCLHYTLGADNDGRLRWMKTDILADAGAYASTSQFVTWRSTVQATGPYRVPWVRTRVRAAFTNNNYTGAMRGFGSPQVNFAIESFMDELAEKVGKNPLEIRLLNAYRDGDITPTGQQLPGKVTLVEALENVACASDFEKKWAKNRSQQKETGAIKRGIGLACSYRGVSLGAEGVDAAGTLVAIQTDGSVIVSSGITDMGQGAQTALSAVVAEQLGISLSRIRFLNTDTDRVPDSSPTVASRGTIMGGGAAFEAGIVLKNRLLELAARLFGGSSSDYSLAQDALWRKKQRLLSFSELADKAFANAVPLMALGWHKGPKTSWHEEQGQGTAYFTYVYGANAAEIEVDTETGQVRVLNVWACHEVGKVVSYPQACGQVYGGVVMGTGYCLFEEYYQEEAIPKVQNFDEYTLPTALDSPQIQVSFLEHPDELSPTGAKSLGEPATELCAPAIVNAIFNATGKRIRELPASLERVLLGRQLRRSGARTSLCKETP